MSLTLKNNIEKDIQLYKRNYININITKWVEQANINRPI